MSNENNNLDVQTIANQIITTGAASVSSGGRTITFISVADFINWIKFQNQNSASKNPAANLRWAHMEGGSTRW